MILDPDIYAAVLDSLETGVYVVDRDRRIVLWNSGAEKITGYLRHEVIGRACADLLMHCDASNTILCGVACPLAHTMREGTPGAADVYLLHKDGQRVPVRVRASAIRDEDGSIVGAAESFDEGSPAIAELHPHNRAVHDSRDALTGLPDRASIRSHLTASLEDFMEERIPFAVLSVEVERLNEIRKFHGGKAAEAILRAAGRTLSRSIRPEDVVGRWSSDGFVAVLADCPGTAAPGVARRLQRIVSLASVPWWGEHITFAIAVGATGVRDDDDAESLVRRAEEALRESQSAAGVEAVS